VAICDPTSGIFNKIPQASSGFRCSIGEQTDGQRIISVLFIRELNLYRTKVTFAVTQVKV
jgi:hypothetical protein